MFLPAARTALDEGVSGALASGFHHAFADHGEGFCTFNGLVVALEALRAEGRIQSAAILDLDLHYGNGTASLAASRPWIKALSIYGNDYANNVAYRDVSVRRHTDGENHFSVPDHTLRKRRRASAKPSRRASALVHRRRSRPDLLLFQAGADPLRDDPYSPLNLDHRDLFLRDKKVFAFARANGLPVAWVLAGGYAPEVQKVVDAHVNTAMACLEIYSSLVDTLFPSFEN